MPASILGTLFFSRDERKPAWHRIGTQFPVEWKIGAVEAFRRGGMAVVPIEHIPMAYVKLNLVTGLYEVMAHPITGEQWVSNKLGVVRLPFEQSQVVHELNTVTVKYVPITNLELCEALDANGVSAVWPVESLGYLGKGDVFFITFDAGMWHVKGDEQQSYLFVVNSLSGHTGLQMGVTDVRMVCQNTVRLGLERATIKVNIPHTSGAKDNLAFWSSIVPDFKQVQERNRQVWERLAEYRISQEETAQVFEAAWPEPPVPDTVTMLSALQDAALDGDKQARLEAAQARWDDRVRRVTLAREAAWELLGKTNDEIAQRELAGTAYVAVNVVSELANYRRGWLKGDAAKLPTSILTGDRQQEINRGFAKAFELVGV